MSPTRASFEIKKEEAGLVRTGEREQSQPQKKRKLLCTTSNCTLELY